MALKRYNLFSIYAGYIYEEICNQYVCAAQGNLYERAWKRASVEYYDQYSRTVEYDVFLRAKNQIAAKEKEFAQLFIDHFKGKEVIANQTIKGKQIDFETENHLIDLKVVSTITYYSDRGKWHPVIEGYIRDAKITRDIARSLGKQSYYLMLDWRNRRLHTVYPLQFLRQAHYFEQGKGQMKCLTGLPIVVE